ncbi:MAG: hypothetical protein NC320_07420 [Clostridium sp.]|nr:hypothetical protein [Clostridium sp.]MCM1546892.1 hypothetical protein [Ruminococcus sp.]
MTDYKELFYKSQAKIADVIEELDGMSQLLKDFMNECEEKVISDEDKNIEIKAVPHKDCASDT